MSFRKSTTICALVLSLSPVLAVAQVEFTDVTDFAGVASTPTLGVMQASSSAWGDYNKDRLPDLFLPNSVSMPALFKNLGNGRFEDVTLSVMTKPIGTTAGYWGDQLGSAWADFDNDGDQDLVVLCGANNGVGSGPKQLFVNTGGLLVDQAKALGMEYPLARGRQPTWLDYDNDGRLDLLVGAPRRPDGQSPPTLFRNLTTRFVDVREETGFKPLANIGSWISDLNRDGRMDILFRGTIEAPVAPIWSSIRIIETSAPFRDTTPVSFRATEGDVVAADFDRDLRPDLFMCNVWRSGSPKPFGHELYLNLSSGFVNRTAGSGINAVQRPCWSAVAADFDNDMDVDVFMLATDKPYGPSPIHGGALPNVILWNKGDGTFVADGKDHGALGRMTGFGDGVTVADYDVDGFVDLFLTYNGAEGAPIGVPSQLYRNGGNHNHWIEFDLIGIHSNRDGVGAQVYVTAGGITQLREQTGGVHLYFGQNHQRLHFGLGSNSVVHKFVIHWPSGRKQTYYNVPANQVIRISEPRR